MEDLLQTFESELRRSAEQIQELLLTLDAAPAEGARSALQECYRLTHSVKGAARVVGLESVEALAHELEERLQALVRADRRPGGAETTAFLKVVDGFVAALEAFLAGEDVDTVPWLQPLASGPALAEPAAAPAPSGTSAPVPLRRDDAVRVTTSGLDALSRGVEELLLLQVRAEATLARVEQAFDEEPASALRTWEAQGPTLRREMGRLRHALVALHELARSFRLEPLERLRLVLQRTVRELGQSLGRPVAFRMSGHRELVDAALLDALREPLVHLLRNAVDHGIEPPAERAAAGKPAEAVVELHARLAGPALELVVSDDGRGIDVARVRERSVERGLVGAEEAARRTDAEWLAQVFAPGFSTASQVSTLSGRGMGLDIVRERVRGLGGDVAVGSHPGGGTRFTLRVPVAVSTRRALVVRAAAQVAAVPVPDVEAVVRLGPGHEQEANGRRYVRWQDVPVAVEPLAARLGWSPGAAEAGTHALVVSTDAGLRALAVDEVVGELEQPTLPPPWNVTGLRWLGGVLLGTDGSLLPLLDVRELLAAAHAPSSAPVAKGAGERLRVLVTDDSPTIRALHRSVLQAAGYDVVTAEDGAEALALLQTTHVDLLLTDIQMPRVDGLSLVRRVRQVPAWRHLPVVVVSQYGRQDDLRAASAAGADRYIVKSAFTPGKLLETVAELVG